MDGAGESRILFTPIQIKTMRLPNRIILTAMVTRLSGEDGFVNQDITDRYVRFARGEPGLIVLEAMAVHGSKSGPLLRISDDQFIPGLRDLARQIHDVSPSKVVPQIIHFLKIARSGWRQKVTDLSRAEMRAIVEAYGSAAGRAVVAGYDGVELHMAHAYTLSSFLSRHNSRPDEYGGKSLENRMRLMTEVIGRVRQEVGDEFPLGVRFDGEECIKGGYSLEESKLIALRMAQLGVDYISISAGGKFEDAIKKPNEPLYPYTGYSGDRTMPGASYPDGYNVYLAEGIKAFINGRGYHTPVVTTGKIPTFAVAESLLRAHRADLIGMARTLLADPDWPRKVRDGREDAVVRCVYGNLCKALDENFKRVVCGSLWPKGALQAPYSTDTIPPAWPTNGNLQAVEAEGRVRVTWEPAVDNEDVYGYEIARAIDRGPFEFLTNVKSTQRTFFDHTAVGGFIYAYRVRAYDLAGNRSAPSNVATLALDLPVSLAPA